MSEKFPEEVVVTHSVPIPKWHPSSHAGGPPANLIYERVVLDADPPHAVIGGAGGNGRVTVAAKDDKPLAELIAGDNETVVAAGQAGGRPGRLTLYDGAGEIALNLTAANARVSLYDGKRKETIRLDAGAGDIVLFNADCAEEFNVSDADAVEPGTVMVLEDDSRLRPSDIPYDTRVAGVVSGAGGFRPAVVLDRRPDDANRTPVALVGKVFCRVDADAAPIRIGDLLTTGCIRGHAMKACDRERAFGSVLGKALYPLDSGKGLIPVLVALQ